MEVPLHSDMNEQNQEDSEMANLSLQHINKTYPNGFEAVKDFNLEIADKEFIIFVGPSVWRRSLPVH